ncbi:hypothetical protein NDU88_003296 [Pleurodeles waltl]|uniref:PiggyBac transposable element-derived protein domain-containing protein n=1 Tax=Pleurodeles waltl TaxID=8319 RepID=A0AAV7NL18_PLEWA|nr:hypothetical protein NDU88_003296 [Pleurodeles waltl]
MASRRMTAQQVVSVLFESSSDHEYETDSASEAEEEVQDSGSEFSVRDESSDDEATLSADEGPVLEEDSDVPMVQEPVAERLPIGRPDTWVAPNMEQPQLPTFAGFPGCRVNTENFLPVNFFELFMDDIFLEEIVEQTNLYAEQFLRDKAARLRPHSRASRWIPTNLKELKKFLGLTFLMGLIRKPSLSSYWSTSPLMATAIFPAIMSRNQYELLLRMLHFVDNALALPRDHLDSDRLFKIRPVLDHLVDRFSEIYVPGKEIYVDESLVLFKGRLVFMQYIPSKRARVDTFACGTIRSNRKGYPRELVCKKIEKGQCSALRNDELLALKFVDKRDVYILSTIHGESTSPVAVWGQVAEVRKPVCLLDYNKHMGGVDRVDQRLEPYTAARKPYVWYKKLAVHLFHLAAFNAFVVFKDSSPESRMTFVKFQESIIASLVVLEQARVPREAVVEDVARLKDRHFAEHIPATAQKNFPANRCRVCARRGIRKETRMYCPDCPSKPGLCVGGCFRS